MLFTKFFCICNFLLEEKYTPRTFIVSVVKTIHLIIQTAILTSFREPMAATLHFNISNMLGFKLAHPENNLKVFIRSKINI